MSGDAQAHLVDLDDALITWAMDKLGSDYTVEKVDASKVRPPPTSLPPICLPAQLHGRRLQGMPTAHHLPTYRPLITCLPPTTLPRPTTWSRKSTLPRYAHHLSPYHPPASPPEYTVQGKVTRRPSYPLLQGQHFQGMSKTLLPVKKVNV